MAKKKTKTALKSLDGDVNKDGKVYQKDVDSLLEMMSKGKELKTKSSKASDKKLRDFQSYCSRTNLTKATLELSLKEFKINEKVVFETPRLFYIELQNGEKFPKESCLAL